jgi:toxin YoeB
MPEAQADLDFWIKSENKPVLKKIILLLESILETPYNGIGKPEPLKFRLSGCWSRRITLNIALFMKYIMIKLSYCL